MLAALRDAHTLEGLAEESDIVIEAALEDLSSRRLSFARSARATRAGHPGHEHERAEHHRYRRGQRPRRPSHRPPLLQPGAGHAARRGRRRRAHQPARSSRERGSSPPTWASSPWSVGTRPASSSIGSIGRSRSRRCACSRRGRRASSRSTGAVRSAGYPMGPFELMDLVGVDVNLAVATALWNGFDEALRFTPSQIQRDLVDAGNLGRKTGEGFYRYEDGRPTAVAWESNPEACATRRSWRASSSRSSTRRTRPSAREWPSRVTSIAR